MKFLKFSCFLSVFCFLSSLQALELSLPLSSVSQSEILTQIAPHLSQNFLTTSLALGSREKGRLGFLYKTVDVSKLSFVKDNSSLYILQWFATKGLYRNFDVFFQSSSLLRDPDINTHSLGLKWSFWHSQKFPFALAFLTHIQWAHILGYLHTKTLGYSLVLGLELTGASSFYLGLGLTDTSVMFQGTYQGLQITESSEKEEKNKNQWKTFIGFYQEIGKKFFVATEASYFKNLSYAFKAGLTF